MPDACWIEAGRHQPPPGRLVAVRVRDRALPMIGWYRGLVPGPAPQGRSYHSWSVPGYGGVVSFWCDCIPPLTDPTPPEKGAVGSIPIGP